MEYKEIKHGVENNEDLQKMKEKERTDRLEAAKLCGKFSKPVVSRPKV
jgi:hypothetical protein